MAMSVRKTIGVRVGTLVHVLSVDLETEINHKVNQSIMTT